MLLVIEPDPSIREILYHLLHAWSIPADIVPDPDIALVALRSKDYKVILIGEGASHIGTEHFVQICKDLYKKARIILMSTLPAKLLEGYAAQLGIRDYITKPFDIHDLEKIIHGYPVIKTY